MSEIKIVRDGGPWKGMKLRGALPKGIVIHAMGQYINGRYASEWLKERLSVHAFIDPNGTIVLAVPSNCTAWHAGEADHNGLKDLNKWYLGVELLVKGDINIDMLYRRMEEPGCYTEAQYESLAYLLTEWMAINPDEITRDQIVGHEDVSGDDVRGAGNGKRDPGKALDWDKLYHLMEEKSWEDS